MKMWGKVTKLSLTALGASGLALVSYVVEHGQLPAWLSQALQLIWELLTVTSLWEVWELILPVLIVGFLGIYLVETEVRKIKIQDAEISELRSELSQLKTRHTELLNSNKEIICETISSASVQPILTTEQFQILSLIADFENSSAIANLSNLLPHSDLQKLNMINALDELIEYKLVHKIRMYIESKYQLTPTGRKFVLNNQ